MYGDRDGSTTEALALGGTPFANIFFTLVAVRVGFVYFCCCCCIIGKLMTWRSYCTMSSFVDLLSVACMTCGHEGSLQ